MALINDVTGDNITWLADGYKYGAGQRASNQFLADKPPLPFRQKVVKLGSENVLVKGAHNPQQAELQLAQNSKLSDDARLRQYAQDQLMKNLREPLLGDEANKENRLARPKSAPYKSSGGMQTSNLNYSQSQRYNYLNLNGSSMAIHNQTNTGSTETIVHPPTTKRPQSATPVKRTRFRTSQRRPASACANIQHSCTSKTLSPTIEINQDETQQQYISVEEFVKDTFCHSYTDPETVANAINSDPVIALEISRPPSSQGYVSTRHTATNRPRSAPVTKRPGSGCSVTSSNASRMRTSARSVGRSPAELRKSYSFISRQQEDEKYRRQTYASPCPSYRYMDRRTRCFDNAHVHTQLNRHRASPACHCGEPGNHTGTGLCQFDLEERQRIEEESRAYYKRYVDNMRPRTAPGRCAWNASTQDVVPENQVDAHAKVAPHFCNFVRKARLSEKDQDRNKADHIHSFEEPRQTRQSSISTLSGHCSSRKRSSLGRKRGSSADGNDTGNGGKMADDTDDVFTENDAASTVDNWPTDVVEAVVLSNQIDPYLMGENTRANTPNPDQDNSGYMSPGPPSVISSSDGRYRSRPEIRIPTPRPESPVEDRENQTEVDTLINNDAIEDEDTESRPVVDTVPEPEPKHKGPNQHANEPQTVEKEPPKERKPRIIIKKERKPFERQRAQRDEEEVEEVKAPTPPPQPEPEPEPEQKPVTIPEPPKPVIVVPPLPTLKPEVKLQTKRMTSRAGRVCTLIAAAPEVTRPTSPMTEARKAFELNLPDTYKSDYVPPKPQLQTWMLGRLALSQQAARFELPNDMKLFETMTVAEYLKQYCVITSHRHMLYKKVHKQYLKHREEKINIKDLEKALGEVLINSITKADIATLCDMIGLNEDTGVEYALFAGIASLAERILYPKFVTEDTQDIAEFKKEKIEVADFSCLDWKLHGLNVNPKIRRVLELL